MWVARPGGVCKVMVYNRHSLVAYRLWVRHALLKGRPSRSLAWVLHNHMESTGTKGYTAAELAAMLAELPVADVRIQPLLTWHDTLGDAPRPIKRLLSAVARLLGYNRVGLFMTLELTKAADGAPPPDAR